MEAQVRRLVDLSGLSDPLLKKETEKFILKKGLKRPISKLIGLVGHPCAQEQIENINKEFRRKYDAAGDEEGIIKPFLRDEILESMAHNTASIVGEGFDIAFKDNLQVNSVTGAVTVNRDPTTGQPDTRFTKCAAAEVPLEMPAPSPAQQKLGPKTVYKNPSDFREFLQKQSDPYKGSQQGVGRTRKHKKRAKKTLRRRKVGRNMH